MIEVNFYIQKTIIFNVLKKDALSPGSIKRGNFITHNPAVLQIIDTQTREDFYIKCLGTLSLIVCAFVL